MKTPINELKRMFISDTFEEPYAAIELILEESSIDNDLFNFILSIEDKLVVAEFLEKYDSFSKEQLLILESYIHKNLNSVDPLFVSDLIEIANLNDIQSVFYPCIDFAKNPKNDSNVVLSSIFYICENLRLHNIELVFNTLNKILDDSEYYQNCELVASFFLFRFSHEKKYFIRVKDLVDNGQEMNIEVLKNLLDLDYNTRSYFAYSDDFQKMIS